MPITIASNIASLGAQRQLGKATESLGSIYERLSSGMRINKASDDAAGLAIADSLKADTRIYSQAIKNISDGVSLVNIADSALSSLSEILIRQKELAEQAANGTYTLTQRKALHDEAKALTSEYNRIVSTTKFNGISLFDTSNGVLSIQAGYGTNSILSNKIGEEFFRDVGTGTFTLGTSFGSGLGNTLGITTGDVNGNGLTDVIVGSRDTNTIVVYNNAGDGTFNAIQTLTTGSFHGDIVYEDINGDGVKDIIVAEETAIRIFTGNSNGSFATAVTLAAGAIGSRSIALAVGDFNGDGLNDIASISQNDNNFSVFINQGSGTFAPRVSYTIPNTGTNINLESISLADFNNDGVLDIITASFDANTVNISFGRGDGTFNNAVSYNQGVSNNPRTVLVGDFNNDGYIDFISPTSNANNIFLNNGDGTFRQGTSFAPNGSAPQSGTVSDLNGDGIDDITLFYVGSNTVATFLGNGDGTFRVASSIANPNAESGAYADLNNDGVLELIATTSNGGSRVQILNQNIQESASQEQLYLLSQSGARSALDRLDFYLTNVNQERASLGSFNNRLNYATNNLRTTIENYRAAESRIRDIDVAEESANLLRTQILQQTVAQVLKQVNLVPELSLRLLNGG
jgi:flagellin